MAENSCDRRFAITLAAGIALTVSCSAPSDAAGAAMKRPIGTLQIIQKGWTGHSRSQPAPITSVHRTVPRTEIVLGAAAGRASVRVIDAADGTVGITAEKVARVNPGGGINLSSCGRQSYRLRVNDTIRFATCSTDVGITWTVKRLS